MFCRLCSLRKVSAREVLLFLFCACRCFFSSVTAALLLLLLVPSYYIHDIGFSRRAQATAIYPVTSTVHHSCSRPASAIKAKQRNASPDRLPITEWWSDPCRLPIPVPICLSVPGSAKGKQAANLPGPIDKTTVGPHNNRQPASKHTLPPTYAYAQRQQHRPARHRRRRLLLPVRANKHTVAS